MNGIHASSGTYRKCGFLKSTCVKGVHGFGQRGSVKAAEHSFVGGRPGPAASAPPTHFSGATPEIAPPNLNKTTHIVYLKQGNNGFILFRRYTYRLHRTRARGACVACMYRYGELHAAVDARGQQQHGQPKRDNTAGRTALYLMGTVKTDVQTHT